MGHCYLGGVGKIMLMAVPLLVVDDKQYLHYGGGGGDSFNECKAGGGVGTGRAGA